MVCCQEDHGQFQLWNDFPKGLRVLLLCNDTNSASQTLNTLEQMDYIVFWYSNFEDAQKAISEKAKSFHVAILEVTTDNCPHSYKFLEAARQLPVIVISSDSSLSTMMKCIAVSPFLLGAVEFLQKPLSEDKLRNIWQHVIHKVFNSRNESDTTVRTVKPIKEMVDSMFHLNQEENVEISGNESPEKLTRPLTPQLECKLVRSSSHNESEEKNIKPDETTCNDSVIAPNKNKNEDLKELTQHDEEVNSIEISKSEGHGTLSLASSKKKKHGSSSLASKDNKKKSKRKVDWTPDLHKRFVKAVEQLGIDQAIPSKILDLMKVEGLTRHNIASHLQKYRMHRRHILPKEDERWKIPRDPCPRSYMQRPIIAPHPPFNQYYSTVPPFAPWYHHQSYYYSPFQPWQVPVQEPWPPWRSYPAAVNADAWGCPVYPPPYARYNIPSPMLPPTYNKNGTENSSNSFSLDEEVIDKVVKEALAKPWAPLPLGLTPPSTELVLSELHRLGIHTVPLLPTAQRTNHNIS